MDAVPGPECPRGAATRRTSRARGKGAGESEWGGVSLCTAHGAPSQRALSPQHMREAAERRQQLELEHEQALAVLNAKQQEIDLLQKVSGGHGAQVGQREEAGSGPRMGEGLWVRAGCLPRLLSQAGGPGLQTLRVLCAPRALCFPRPGPCSRPSCESRREALTVFVVGLWGGLWSLVGWGLPQLRGGQLHSSSQARKHMHSDPATSALGWREHRAPLRRIWGLCALLLWVVGVGSWTRSSAHLRAWLCPSCQRHTAG